MDITVSIILSVMTVFSTIFAISTLAIPSDTDYILDDMERKLINLEAQNMLEHPEKHTNAENIWALTMEQRYDDAIKPYEKLLEGENILNEKLNPEESLSVGYAYFNHKEHDKNIEKSSNFFRNAYDHPESDDEIKMKSWRSLQIISLEDDIVDEDMLKDYDNCDTNKTIANKYGFFLKDICTLDELKKGHENFDMLDKEGFFVNFENNYPKTGGLEVATKSFQKGLLWFITISFIIVPIAVWITMRLIKFEHDNNEKTRDDIYRKLENIEELLSNSDNNHKNSNS